MSNQLSNALSLVASERRRIAGSIEEAKAVEARCAGRIAELMAMPVSLDDFGAYLRAHVDRLGQAWVDCRFLHLMLSQTGGVTPTNKAGMNHFEDEFEAIRQHVGLGRASLEGGDAFHMMCFLDPELVHARLMDALRRSLGKAWRNEALPPVAQRREEIRALRNQAAETALERESLARELAGFDVAL